MTRRTLALPRPTSVVLVLVLAAGLTVGGLGGGSPATADGACSRTPTYKVSFKSWASWYTFNSNRTASGRIDQWREYLRKDVKTGKTTLVYDMCKVPSTGAWKVNRMLVRSPHKDLAVTWVGRKMKTIKPATGSPYGYGSFVRKRSASTVTFDATRCTRKPVTLAQGAWATVKGLLNLPWKVPQPVAVGMYVAGQVLPDAPEDKYWCQRMGKPITLKVRFSQAEGRPSIVWPPSGHKGVSIKTPQREYPCSGETYVYCSDSDWQVLWLRKP